MYRDLVLNACVIVSIRIEIMKTAILDYVTVFAILVLIKLMIPDR